MSAEVDSFLASLKHPRLHEVAALREVILAADPSIGEGIKWNAPSFRTTEWFGTFHLRAKQGVQLILHRGAKRREDAASWARIEDPESLLRWLGDDRASVTFQDLDDVRARQAAFSSLIRQWIRHV